ncbi:2,4'-dihydroxyacetophenone dioxygenase family protein [Oceanibaculum sp.]|uniref:2,4'-dihydroxyacetophenone dioxygenase family protein n=1 Tax=Oceanibaculum sp. TaxID=1903597 RepID=UPI00258E47C0|nr:2,4'-dihydroxyacetophenone dioxygenase family protein [Oceanibaculum sp.]MCH2395526.1 2,4'-dihydroxyacetophenone dioxygenase family protein [Oceanibaculum sp.]
MSSNVVPMTEELAPGKPGKNFVRIPLPMDAAPELVIDTSGDDERMWMQLSDNVWIRPLMLNVVQGSWVNILKAKAGGIVSRHRHPAMVTGYTLDGAWGYLEHDWVATKGTFIFEPAGETHTLVVDPKVGHMTTLFHNMGPLLYVDENGKQTGYEDVFTRIEKFRAYYRQNGLGEGFIEQLIR